METTPAARTDALRLVLLCTALVLGGVVASTTTATTTGAEEVVTTRSSDRTVGVRRRQLTRRLDAPRRRRHGRPAVRFWSERAVADQGCAVPTSVRGPPGR